MVADSDTERPLSIIRDTVRMVIYYKGGKGSYVQNPAIHVCPKALVRIGTLRS